MSLILRLFQRAGVGFDTEILRQMDVIVVVLKCFDSTHLAQYINTFDPLKDVMMIGQELLQMVPFAFYLQKFDQS